VSTRNGERANFLNFLNFRGIKNGRKFAPILITHYPTLSGKLIAYHPFPPEAAQPPPPEGAERPAPPEAA
jgi:hypothetical protein